MFWQYSWNHMFALMRLIFQWWETSSKKTDSTSDSKRGEAGMSNKGGAQGLPGLRVIILAKVVPECCSEKGAFDQRPGIIQLSGVRTFQKEGKACAKH